MTMAQRSHWQLQHLSFRSKASVDDGTWEISYIKENKKALEQIYQNKVAFISGTQDARISFVNKYPTHP
jgi:hypothetical protein